jgi:hypothetical protein
MALRSGHNSPRRASPTASATQRPGGESPCSWPPPLRIVAATAEFLSAPSLRAFDLLQEAEPYLKEIGAGFVCCHHGCADLIRPNPTAAR